MMLTIVHVYVCVYWIRSSIERGEKTLTPKISALLTKTARFTKGQFRPY